MSYLILPVLQIFLLSVGRGFTSNKLPPKRTIESFFMASTKQACQHNENETVVDEGEVGGVGVADENGMFYFEPPPPPCHFLFCSATADV